MDTHQNMTAEEINAYACRCLGVITLQELLDLKGYTDWVQETVNRAKQAVNNTLGSDFNFFDFARVTSQAEVILVSIVKNIHVQKLPNGKCAIQNITLL
jgi:hypothetical protein